MQLGDPGLRDRPNLGRLAGCCHPAPLHAATCSLRAPPIASAGPFGGISPPEQCAASWSCSSSRNPLGNCISARPETGLGPDSARTRFLSSRLAAQFLIRRTGTVATPSRGTGDICLPRLAPLRGRTHQLRSPFPRLPGLIPVAPSAGFSCRRALDCSIKERADYPIGSRESPTTLALNLLTARAGEYLGSGDLLTRCSPRGWTRKFRAIKRWDPAPAGRRWRH